MYEGGFLEASRVTVREFSRVTHISGCSAVFFFNTVGKVSTAHVTAGKEKKEAKDAAKQAKKAGTISFVEVHTHAAHTFKMIEMAIQEVLPQTDVEYKRYTLNTSDWNAS